MDNLRKSIEIIFSKNCPDTVLTEKEPPLYVRDEIFSIHEFRALGIQFMQNNNINEIENLLQKLNEDWFYDVYQERRSKSSIFNLFTHFNKQVLEEIDKQPFVKYEHLLRWRELSHVLGEDVFTCSYLAYMDNRSSRIRSFFAWRPVIFSNNIRLKKMLEQGLAENHFHLKGSGPVFELSWMAAMNRPSEMMEKFRTLKKDFRLNNETISSFSTSKKDIDILVYKAAYIRFELFKEIILNIQQKNEIYDFETLLNKESNKKDSFEVQLNLGILKREIQSFTAIHSYSFTHKGTHEFADYYIPKNLTELNFEGATLLYGERFFLYSVFKRLFSNQNEDHRLTKLFYSYLLIKNQFRAELIQVNKKVGFGNFLSYQNRKELFLPEGSIYETAFLSMAVNDSRKFQNIESFELRIAPKTNSIDLYKNLIKLEKAIDKKSIAENHFQRELDYEFSEQNEFYTVHFIKRKDKKSKNNLVSTVTCRDNELRKEVKEQARAIVMLRESYSKKSKVIRGIDAASSEFDARPEVFAQVYRYLKDHKLKGKFDVLKTNKDNEEHKLYSSFHAGEDFYDIVDGLRTIDEVIKFLNFRQGDRIGHALALGINPKDYFNFKGRKLMIPKGILLDNISWLLAQIRKANINDENAEIHRLKKKFDSLFYEIYQQKGSIFYGSSNVVTHEQYYNAWKLRGDDPYLYKIVSEENNVETIPNVTYWERCRINHFYPLKSKLRKHLVIKKLYHAYHFDPLVKKHSDETSQFEITDNYVNLVFQVQKYMQKNVMEMNLGIECNPTSNYLIGTFKRYDKHPIIDFYNLGLETDPQKIKDSPQLFVSINTDDQGIFGTSLENEFALMAIALEKAKDEFGNKKYKPSMIYDWLDRIRRMGLEQSFKDNELKNENS